MSVLEQVAASETITRKVLALLESDFKGANIFLCFYPFGSEVDLLPLYEKLLEDGKALYFPVSIKESHELVFRRVFDLNNDFEEGFKGIMEPKECLETLDFEKQHGQKIVSITPGVAFDRNMNRIGYGGGFYDRFFAKNPEIIRLAPVFSSQITEAITAESHDLPVDYIVTENEIMKGDRL